MAKIKDPIKIIAAVMIIGVATLLIYRSILFPTAGGALYPWASDTQGHLLKVEYLSENLDQGLLSPQNLPDWYMGMEFMRYYPPLPYYVLVVLQLLISNTVSAANWFIGLCALAGGLSWLLYRRWIGFLPALVGGVLFLFLPDNIRVALAEGNLPRVLATALLPVTIYLLLRALGKTGTVWHRTALAICFGLIVLSHAMMAAIYAVCCGLMLLFLVFKRTITIQKSFQIMLFISLGIMFSAWWLLPSFSGGITELDTSAMTEALAVFPITNYFNPTLRIGNPEAVYIGLALFVLSIASLWVYQERRGFTSALTFTGCFGVLITTSGFNQFFNALPLHNLLWPLRFLGIASFALLLALMWSLRGWKSISPVVVFTVVAVLAIDGAGSLFLIGLRPVDADMDQINQRLAVTNGWREATLDLSRLGSGPSLTFTTVGKREQIFGWAYQGARTAKTVAALNDAIELGFPAYLINRLDLYGTDDVVLLDEIPNADHIAAGLQQGGYLKVYSGERVDFYHREGTPRAFIANWNTLGIGRGAQNLAYIFPGLILGTSTYVDDYSLDHLLRYKTIVLSGFDWHDRQQAEQLVEQVARLGVHVIVDLTGVKTDPLARIPRFLNVWGEQAIVSPAPVKVFSLGKEFTLEGFNKYSQFWYSHMLQGLEQEFWTFDYLGERGGLVGYNSYGEGKVWFVGLNLPFHAVQTRDPLAIQMLSLLLQMEPEVSEGYTQLPLEDYQAGGEGYKFSYHLESPQTLFVPVAFHEGTLVFVDGVPAETKSYERLLVFEAPAGEHEVQIGLRRTSAHLAGMVVSGLAMFGLVGIVIFQMRNQVTP
jgi:uncharacterized membrane protein